MDDEFEYFVVASFDCFSQLCGEFVFVSAGEACGVVVDWGAGVADHEYSPFGFGYLYEVVFGVAAYDGFW